MTSVFPDAHEDLQFALDRNELVLAYQPIVDLNDGSLGGVEALLRWNHPTRGLLWPGDFLAAIEGTEMSTKLGSYVIDGPPARPQPGVATPGNALPVAINVSGATSSPTTWSSNSHMHCARNDLEPGALALEVGERTLFTRHHPQPCPHRIAEASRRADRRRRFRGDATAMDGDWKRRSPAPGRWGRTDGLVAVSRDARRVLGRRDRDRSAPLERLFTGRQRRRPRVRDRAPRAPLRLPGARRRCGDRVRSRPVAPVRLRLAQGYYFHRPQSPEYIEIPSARREMPAAKRSCAGCRRSEHGSERIGYPRAA